MKSSLEKLIALGETLLTGDDLPATGSFFVVGVSFTAVFLSRPILNSFLKNPRFFPMGVWRSAPAPGVLAPEASGVKVSSVAVSGSNGFCATASSF